VSHKRAAGQVVGGGGLERHTAASGCPVPLRRAAAGPLGGPRALAEAFRAYGGFVPVRPPETAVRRGRGIIQSVDEHARLIGDLRDRAEDPARRTDIGRRKALPPPASAGDLVRAAQVIGCELPPVIAGVYSGIANGGFGPGYGLVGIGSGSACFANGNARRNCEEQYAFFRQIGDCNWPAHLLPVCDWGCGIYSCADASRAEAPMSTAVGDLFYDNPAHAVSPAGCTFAEWLRAWADGADLWQALNDALPPV
jgi:hypothetical protein